MFTVSACRKLSKLSPLEVWYERLDAQTIIDTAPTAEIRKFREQVMARGQGAGRRVSLSKISNEVAGRRLG